MKPFRTGAGTGSILFLFFAFAVMSPMAGAAELRAARVTKIINDVKLLPGQAAARAAAVNDELGSGTAVRTGVDSRTELTFSDLTITRLGANTIFSFSEGARTIELGGGAVLVQVPRNGAEAKIATAAVTAAITGGTALFESNKGLPTKLLMLEGTGRFYPTGHPEEAAIVHGGEMVMRTVDGRITQPAKFNAALVYKTSRLITSFSTLPNADLILAVIEQQQAEISEGPSNPPPSDPIDTTSQAIVAAPPAAAGSIKFGPPTAITVPNPYAITSGTAINTDPTITTNGITNFGKIYRGAALDGPLPTWLGSSPSSFDSVDFVNSTGGGFISPSADTLPIPGFLFVALQLDGDPTVLNSNGYPTLGLVSQGNINTSASGTVFTFGGMQQVALISLNGSIDLSGISFANFGELFVYARGMGSNVTFAAPVSNLDRVQLRAEGDIDVSSTVTLNSAAQNHRGFKALAGNNLTVSSAVTSTGGGITLQSLGGITVSSTAQLRTILDAMGNSGQIIILASGSDTSVSVSGTVQATQAEVDIRQTGLAGSTTLNNATIHGDVVKISALGTNGTLNIGPGNVLGADTILKLYAPGSNGTLNFLSNVTLSSPTNILAANTINISPGVMVTINSAQQADVFTNNPNYFGFGGTGTPANSGTFGGVGAKNPLPLSAAPPLGGPGQGP
ncbi:MAG TPA: FecR domain-containing protein [Chthoniobacterales bacterium]|nr:FecR domain-containing protein [Chthoniobacterales bacterium]